MQPTACPEMTRCIGYRHSSPPAVAIRQLKDSRRARSDADAINKVIMRTKPAASGSDPILLSHGGGGLLTRRLVKELIVRHLGNSILNELDDGALLKIKEKDAVFTTDSYVVRPIVFPGGDIGRLAACGTINDLVMMGAEPRFLSLGLILEEGLPMADLERALASMRAALRGCGAKVVTGDTKVVERGMGFGMFINTAGVGFRVRGADTRVANASPGDAVIVTGPVGDHGAAVMSCRAGVSLRSELKSDVAPLWGMLAPVLRCGPRIHCLRDPTRGGLAAALNDIAEASGTGIRIAESAIPVRKEVRGVCGLLGLDPLNLACEGRAVVICPRRASGAILQRIRSHPIGRKAEVIGKVCKGHPGMVILETAFGGERIIEIPTGEDLPRIC